MLSCTSLAPQVTPTYESKQWGEQEGVANQQSSLKALRVSPSGAGGVELRASREALCSQPCKPSELKLMIPSRRMTNPKQTTGWASNSNLSFSNYLSLSIQKFLRTAQYSKRSIHSCCQTTVTYTLLISNCAPKYNIQKSKSHGTCPSLAWKNISLNPLQMPIENKLTWCFLWKPPIFFTAVLWNIQRGRNDKNTNEKFIMKVKGIFAGYTKLKVGLSNSNRKKKHYTSVPMSGRARHNVRKRKAVKNEQ